MGGGELKNSEGNFVLKRYSAYHLITYFVLKACAVEDPLAHEAADSFTRRAIGRLYYDIQPPAIHVGMYMSIHAEMALPLLR